jgi:adenylate cyclase
MSPEIERKFLVNILPDLTGITPYEYERYIIYNEDGIQMRVQKKNDTSFSFERKVKSTNLSSERIWFEITESEFLLLKNLAKNRITRTTYQLSDEFKTSIKIYHEQFEGLVRAEVEFKTEESAKQFSPPSWFGKEITNSKLGNDSELKKLTNIEFKAAIKPL